jgi:hypothetical protein
MSCYHINIFCALNYILVTETAQLSKLSCLLYHFSHINFENPPLYFFSDTILIVPNLDFLKIYHPPLKHNYHLPSLYFFLTQLRFFSHKFAYGSFEFTTQPPRLFLEDYLLWRLLYIRFLIFLFLSGDQAHPLNRVAGRSSSTSHHSLVCVVASP